MILRSLAPPWGFPLSLFCVESPISSIPNLSIFQMTLFVRSHMPVDAEWLYEKKNWQVIFYS